MDQRDREDRGVTVPAEVEEKARVVLGDWVCQEGSGKIETISLYNQNPRQYYLDRRAEDALYGKKKAVEPPATHPKTAGLKAEKGKRKREGEGEGEGEASNDARPEKKKAAVRHIYELTSVRFS